MPTCELLPVLRDAMSPTSTVPSASWPLLPVDLGEQRCSAHRLQATLQAGGPAGLEGRPWGRPAPLPGGLQQKPPPRYLHGLSLLPEHRPQRHPATLSSPTYCPASLTRKTGAALLSMPPELLANHSPRPLAAPSRPWTAPSRSLATPPRTLTAPIHCPPRPLPPDHQLLPTGP